MDFLKYDTDEIGSAKSEYKTMAESMKNISSEMTKAIEGIKESWQSDAGNAFFEKFDQEFLKNFEQYREVLEHFAYNLGIAHGRYEEITIKANALRLR